MRGEMQSSMQSIRVPVLKLQRVEKIYPFILREGMVSALCIENHFIILIPRIYLAKEIKIFLGSLCCLFHLP
jgi:hypothetical protein